MDERREEAVGSIRYHVWSGLYSPDMVFRIVAEDVFDCDDEADDWLRRAVGREFRKKREAERDWPAFTTCDRLDGVFVILRGRGVLTQHRCGMTIQDGLEVIDGIYAEAGGPQSGLIGYCFYHLQDMEAAMSGGAGLLLAFGSLPPNRARAVEVGQIVQEEFERAGFSVKWDGTCENRVFLSDFRWQRRSPDA